MKTTHTPARSGRFGKTSQLPPALPFKVFIGYADLPAVRQATSTIADAIRTRGRRFDIQPMLWPFDQLASAHWRDRAIHAAQTADVIVLASSEPGAGGSEIEHWVDSFLAANRGRRATIVCVSGPTEAWTISIEECVPTKIPAPIPFKSPGMPETSPLLVARVS